MSNLDEINYLLNNVLESARVATSTYTKYHEDRKKLLGAFSELEAEIKALKDKYETAKTKQFDPSVAKPGDKVLVEGAFDKNFYFLCATKSALIIVENEAGQSFQFAADRLFIPVDTVKFKGYLHLNRHSYGHNVVGYVTSAPTSDSHGRTVFNIPIEADI